MAIDVKRHPTTREWTFTIPLEQWDEFEDFSREIRLPWLRGSTSAKGVTLRLPDCFSQDEIVATVGYFFDGIEDLSFYEQDQP